MPRIIPNNIDWVKTISILRSLLDFRQEDLAQELGMCSSIISKWERGACFPQLGSIKRLKSFAQSKRLNEEQWLIRVDAKKIIVVASKNLKP